jgi:hypothetical protein
MSPPLDTSDDVARMQLELWRRMSPVEKLELVGGLTARACPEAARVFGLTP